MTINIFLGLFGVIIFLGFLGQYFFKATKIPVPVILLLAGIVLGLFSQETERMPLFGVAPYFGTLALILILFEGGLELEILDTARQLGSALCLGFLYFSLCWTGAFFIGVEVLKLSQTLSILLGLILAGTSPGILLPTLSQLSLSKEMKTFLALETNFTELLTVIGSLIFIEYRGAYNASPGAGDVLLHFFTALIVALGMALIAGVLWSRFMGFFSQEPLAYMLTLGFLCALYSATQMLGGKGSLAVFFFGLILGNTSWLASRSLPILRKWIDISWEKKNFLVDEIIKKINMELSFLVRTFFFVFLGFLFDFSAFRPQTGLAILALVGWFYLSRWAVCRLLYRYYPFFREVPLAGHLAMIPRGLGNAVMAFIGLDLALNGYSKIPTVVLGVILGTNLLMALFVYQSENQISAQSKPSP